MDELHITVGDLPPECEELRAEVRAFAKEHIKKYPRLQRAHNWSGRDPAFSKKLGEKGWLGMTWPTDAGGGGKSMLERYVMLEELLAVGAPMGAHWAADRQMGPLLIRYSRDKLAPKIIPQICKGEAFICIGMSEPDSGSDLASIRTRGTKVEGGWKINGSKVWTSGAQHAHYMVALVRTSDKGENRHAGMSQIFIEMDRPGVSVRPIVSQLGTSIFNEVTLDDVFVPDDHLVGEEGKGWSQVTDELKFERSGAERFLSSTQLLLEMLDEADPENRQQSVAIGKMIGRYATLRQMSQGIALMMSKGEDPSLAASIVKDQGALLEQSLPDIAYEIFPEKLGDGSEFDQVLKLLTLAAPSFSLRGGTREILRGIIAKGLGLR
ncbi:MAG: acyl-CoA dehydrogenase family protein [Alicycliphilus denitrificans]|nr:acyl-CoA dehydrogenase family protein [Alicycliphilus denitrificans]OJW93099.1 MAG: acyl-CoA dehydrogenase [Alicycliphilus sp. 69-12]HRP21145.1 acyl-CoA dehydrogenase family protein [Alicycliphilus sp.]